MADNTVFDPQKLQSGNLADCEEQQIIELAKKLCRIAAEECGENGFRGGIRPGNIYVAEDGRVAVGKSGKSGENGWTKLELEYLAPEVFWNGDESAAADVYSIALIMYAGLNGGRLPFAGEGEQSSEQRAHALRRRMSGDSFPMPEGLSEKLLEILKRALAFDPAQRFEKPYDMLKALWDYCGDEPEEIQPQPEPAPEPVPASVAEAGTEPEPEAVKEPEPAKEPEPVKKSEPPKKPKPEKKPEKREAAKPTPESAAKTPEAKAPETAPAAAKPVRTIHEKRAARRSAATLALISLLLVGVGFASEGIEPGTVPPVRSPGPDKIETTAEPVQTPGPSKTPTDVQYILYSEDLSWDEAEAQCRSLGGHLATIKDQADYEQLCQLLTDCNAQYVWIGAYRDAGGQIKWADGQSSDFYAWAQGEPSVTDSYDGAAENYVMLVKQSDGTWLYNDSRADPMAQYSSFYSGKIAYICQIG